MSRLRPSLIRRLFRRHSRARKQRAGPRLMRRGGYSAQPAVYPGCFSPHRAGEDSCPRCYRYPRAEADAWMDGLSVDECMAIIIAGDFRDFSPIVIEPQSEDDSGIED